MARFQNFSCDLPRILDTIAVPARLIGAPPHDESWLLRGREMNICKTYVLCAVLSLLTVSQAGAQSIPNYEGMWVAPGEPGWGMTFTHQGDIIFATWFGYGDGNPGWTSMTAQQQSDGSFAGLVDSSSG